MSAPLDHFRYASGTLSVEGVRLEELADQFGTPCYVYSAQALLKPLQELKKGLAGLDHLVCFAVKSCSNIAVLKLLHQAGAGMDLVSGGELHRATAAGVPAGKLVFSGVGKTPGEMARALEHGDPNGDEGIFSFNVESVAELATLSQVAEALGRKARVALRFNPDVDAKSHPYISTGLKKNKFGMDRKEILAIAEGIESFPGIDLKGLSIHIGSQILSLSPLEDAFKRVRALIAELDAILPEGEPLSFVDAGGGLGIAYDSRAKSPPIAKYCALLRKHFGPASALAKSRKGRPLKLLIEPGRSISGNAGVLLTEVMYRKVRKQKDFLVVDAAMNDLVRPALYGGHHEIVPLNKPAARARLKKTDVVGPVCESSDVLASDRKLPEELNQGDLLAVLSAGAYGFSMSSTYNSRPRPPEILVQDGEARVIRERETYEDLVRGESV
jgi:diaminopimelate decarboxylase